MAGAALAWNGYKPESFGLLALAEGDDVLDLGCGTGEDARTIAGLTPGVSVVGIDLSAEKIREAQRRTLGLPRPVDFRVGDAYALGFEDASFDACRADKVFHHLDEPRKALAEMIRVARPGARIVVSDTDYETLIVDAPDGGLTRAITRSHCDRMPSGRIGRQLYALWQEAGLGWVEVAPYTAIVTEYDDQVLHLREKAEHAAATGVISAAAAARWVAGLAEADHAGRFFCALTILTVSGRKP